MFVIEYFTCSIAAGITKLLYHQHISSLSMEYLPLADFVQSARPSPVIWPTQWNRPKVIRPAFDLILVKISILQSRGFYMVDFDLV